MQLEPATLNLNFSDNFKAKKSDAYKRLILDAAAGNPSLFIHRDEVACAWAWVDPIIEQWKSAKMNPHLYRSGSWGPTESDELIQEDGREWYNAGDAEA
jgi:glucose-6-phosphate 1-dehydrogenase